jgi:hypothetical protein
MSGDKRGNGIQEVDGSIPFGSTNNSFLGLTLSAFLFSSAVAELRHEVSNSRFFASLAS